MLLLIFTGAGWMNTVHAQTIPSLHRIEQRDSVMYRTFCKNLLVAVMALQRKAGLATATAEAAPPALFKVKGNVRYDFMYRSFTDTPYAQTDLRQHTIQTNLQVTVKDKYPIRVNLAARVSNSPFFRNFLDMNFQFDRYAFNRDYKQRLVNKITQQYLQNPELVMVQTALKEQLEKYTALKARLNDPDIAQKIVAEKEAEYNRSLAAAGVPLPGSVKPDKAVISALNEQLTHKKTKLSDKLETIDSVKNKYVDFVDDKKQELEETRQQIARLQSKADSINSSLQKKIAQARQLVNRSSSLQELKKLGADHGFAGEQENTLDKFLANVKSLGIGRSVINYSELTATNISLTGVNLEYNPGIYAAFAAGKIDYGFRDFFGRSASHKKQQLIMGRLGLGNIEKQAIILSVFTGRKYNYASVQSDSVSNSIGLAGYSLETILKKNEHTHLHLEIAKSTGPASGAFNENKELGSLFRFNSNSNLAFNIKGQTIIPETATRLSGFFRKSGERFQSFSLFTYNTDQLAWLLKADQSLFKNKIGIIAMLRRNDLTNPVAEKTYKSSTVFKSLQVNVRFPKWPSFSAGYYPGTQLYIIDRERARENVYYILNGSIIHQYKISRLRMLSSFIYNQYQSKGTDTGLIAYSGTNYLLSHSLLFDKLQLQGSFAYTRQPEMKYSVMEFNADYNPVKLLRIGAGGKYNKVINGQVYWGGRAQLMIDLPKIGGLQLQYEKTFLPTVYQTLFPVEIGRVSWYKNF